MSNITDLVEIQMFLFWKASLKVLIIDDIISSAARGSGTGFEHPLPINKPIRHACAYWTSSNLGRETEEI